MERMGCDWETVHRLNPRLVMARISGYGQTGPRSSEPCFEAIAQATTGLMALTGQADGPPPVAGTLVVDYCTALYAALGNLSAIDRCVAPGEGPLCCVSPMGRARST